MTTFSPREIVSELDRFIVGQSAAKRAVAIALRNRWRRQQLEEAVREEVQPKNILMIGPTGVGKTESARRLAKLADAPFIKVEATKFTEVGYVGRDVEQIIRDLIESAISQTREKMRKEVQAAAELAAENRVVDAIAGKMWEHQLDGKDLVFYTTGRLTSEMVIKGAQMHIPILLSRSGVTQMGVEMARNVDMTLLGRCSGKHFYIFNGPQRLIFDSID